MRSSVVVAARHTGAMNASEPVHHIRPGERVEADPTPGMTRERAIEVEGLWAGLVRTEPPGPDSMRRVPSIARATGVKRRAT